MGFEPTISAGERPQTYTLDRAATGTGLSKILVNTKITERKRIFVCVGEREGGGVEARQYLLVCLSYKI